MTKVAIIGAGGIGFDVAEFLLYAKESNGEEIEEDLGVLEGREKGPVESIESPATKVSVEDFWKEWGVDPTQEYRGGLAKEGPTLPHGPPKRSIYLMQRKKGKVGAGLGKTTGWIHRASLQNSKKVTTVSGIKSYDGIDSDGNLVYTLSGSNKGENTAEDQQHVLEVATVVLCAGMES